MSAEDIRTSSDSEDEAIQAAINDDDEDMPYVSSRTRTTRMPTLTSAFTTRMTTREQARMDLEETSMPRLTEERLPAWMEYHQRLAQQLAEGKRAIERIARDAVDASNEPDIHPDPHPLLDGGERWRTDLDPIRASSDSDARLTGPGWTNSTVAPNVGLKVALLRDR